MNITLEEKDYCLDDGINVTCFLIHCEGRASIVHLQSSEHCGAFGWTAEEMRTFANLFVAALKNHETEKQNHE